MTISDDEMTMKRLAARVAEIEESHARKLADLEDANTRLEQANTQLREELKALRTARPTTINPLILPAVTEAKQSRQPHLKIVKPGRKSRRNLLQQGLGVAVAALGAGTLMEASTLQALAAGPHGQAVDPKDNPGNFSSSNSQIPAVTATGTNGATGISATSDSGIGISGTSSSRDGIFGAGGTNGVHGKISGTGCAVLGENDNLGPGVCGTSAIDGPGVSGTSNSGPGVIGISTSGPGISATSISGPGIFTSSTSGTALIVQGTVLVIGNAIGQVTLSAGQKSVTVMTTASTVSSNVLLTPLNKVKGTFWVTRAAGRFTINSNVAQTSNVVFTYLIIN